ncbi:agglutinin-like [Dendrobium catenatum]|uniref:agglutinin-like n=1 Tax=Dendrobium catenatum TaxID=906689 RepID=UPI0010A0490B|nr:agglutinin-like [Dendrobium catenatum]
MQENGEIYIKVGACGSTAGLSNVQDWDDGVHLAIRHIYVCYTENSVNCIQVAYFDPSKGTVLSPKHGNTLSTDFFEEINISPHDPIISVGGSYTEADGYNINKTKQRLTSLKFETVSGPTYGPYGMKASDRKNNSSYHSINNSFCFTTSSGVRGFHGSANDSSLCSIGIYAQSQASSVSSVRYILHAKEATIFFLICSPMTSEKSKIYVKVGACGSSTGNGVQNWDDGFHLAIRHIYVCYSENSVNSIQVAYLDPSNSTVLSPMHGSSVFTDFFDEINISADDLIISVGGCYSTEHCGYNPKQLLTSLKFVTASGKTYGPYGINGPDRKDNPYNPPKNKPFSFKTTSGVRGFHGSTNSSSLSSIGIYVE